MVLRHKIVLINSQYSSISNCRSIGSKSNLIPDKKQKIRNSYPSLSCHWNTIPPTPTQLKKAAEFFQQTSARFLWSTEEFKDMPPGTNNDDSPEVCFLGRSNVGKSTLLNTLLCQRIAFTSAKPGRTKIMNAFAVGPSNITNTNRVEGNKDDNKQKRLIILDVPGYGKGGRADVGQQIIKYLEKRRQLTSAFLLIDSEHGMKKRDQQMFEICKQIGIPFQIILSKVDKVLPAKAILSEELSKSGRLSEVIEQVKQAIGLSTEQAGSATGEIIPCSSTKWMLGRRLGINEVRFAVLRAAGLEYQEVRRRLNLSEIITYDQLFPSECGNYEEEFSKVKQKKSSH